MTMTDGLFQVLLGGKTYDCPPITLGQIKEIAIGLEMAQRGNPADHFEGDMKILLAVLPKVDPAVDRAFLDTVETTRVESQLAVRAILIASEFLKPKEDPTGEAVAEETAQSA